MYHYQPENVAFPSCDLHLAICLKLLKEIQERRASGFDCSREWQNFEFHSKMGKRAYETELKRGGSATRALHRCRAELNYFLKNSE